MRCLRIKPTNAGEEVGGTWRSHLPNLRLLMSTRWSQSPPIGVWIQFSQTDYFAAALLAHFHQLTLILFPRVFDFLCIYGTRTLQKLKTALRAVEFLTMAPRCGRRVSCTWSGIFDIPPFPGPSPHWQHSRTYEEAPQSNRGDLEGYQLWNSRCHQSTEYIQSYC